MPSTKRRSRVSITLSESDRLLLRECGFQKGAPASSYLKALKETVRMRHLDRLKTMFERLSEEKGDMFPEKIRSGIRKNNLDAFASAAKRLLESVDEPSKLSKKN